MPNGATEWATVADQYGRGVISWEQGLTQLADGRLLAVVWCFDERTGRSLPNRFTLSPIPTHISSHPLLSTCPGANGNPLRSDRRPHLRRRARRPPARARRPRPDQRPEPLRRRRRRRHARSRRRAARRRARRPRRGRRRPGRRPRAGGGSTRDRRIDTTGRQDAD